MIVNGTARLELRTQWLELRRLMLDANARGDRAAFEENFYLMDIVEHTRHDMVKQANNRIGAT